MEITLKNLKVMASLSEETTAYTATVCIDGVKGFEASNRGHGGCDDFRPANAYTGPSIAEIDAWLGANLPPIESGFSDVPPLKRDLELHIGELIERAAAEKRLKRLTAKKIVIVRDGKVWTYTTLPTPENIAKFKAKAMKPGDLIINEGSAEAITAVMKLL